MSSTQLDKHRSIERSHSIDDEEFYGMLAGVVIDDAKLLSSWSGSASTISSAHTALWMA